MLSTFVKRFFWLFAVALAVPVHAQTTPSYVTDDFEITFRSGKGTEHKILHMLPTGKPLELLQSDEDGYSRVRTPEGEEGWVLTRYLTNEPVAKEKLASAEKRLAEMKATIADLRSQLKDTSGRKNSLEKSEKGLLQEKERLEKSLAEIRRVSADVISVNDENKTLKSQLLTLRRDMETLRQEKSALQDRSARDWFMVGAGVCVVGILLGLTLPHIRLRRKQSWSSL